VAYLYPKDNDYRASHETIYNCNYAQPVNESNSDLIDCCAKIKQTRAAQQMPGTSQPVLACLRLPEIEDSHLRGNRKMSFIKCTSTTSAVGTLVERTSRWLILIKLFNPPYCVHLV
jgi:IS30 family transposase